MTDIEKSQAFSATADECFEGLLRALKDLRIKALSSNAAERTVIATLSGLAGARYSIQARCVPQGNHGTTVHIVYRRDLTPAIWRPIGATPKSEYTRRVNLILSSLTKHLHRSADAAKMEPESEKKRAIPKRSLAVMLSLGTLAILVIIAWVWVNRASAGLNCDAGPIWQAHRLCFWQRLLSAWPFVAYLAAWTWLGGFIAKKKGLHPAIGWALGFFLQVLGALIALGLKPKMTPGQGPAQELKTHREEEPDLSVYTKDE